MNTTIGQLMEVSSISGAGTSEGASKGWDSRGRGRSALRSHGFKQESSKMKGITSFRKVEKDEHGNKMSHRIDVKDNGAWRHKRTEVAADWVRGLKHGKGETSLANHLNSGEYRTSTKNEGDPRSMPSEWKVGYYER